MIQANGDRDPLSRVAPGSSFVCHRSVQSASFMDDARILFSHFSTLFCLKLYYSETDTASTE